MTTIVCLPVEIIRNVNLSPRARIVWAELSLLPKGLVSEFVVKPKELSKLLGICDSTLRRAVKALEEAGLIQCVGLFEKRFKKYIFKNSSPARAGEENFSLEKLGEGKILSVNSLDASLRWHDKQEKLAPMPSISPSPDFDKSKSPSPVSTGEVNPPTSVGEVNTPQPDNLLRIRHSFGTIRSPDQQIKIGLSKKIYEQRKDRWHKLYPMLNGTNNLPVLDYYLIEAIAMKDLFRRGETALFEYIENELERCSQVFLIFLRKNPFEWAQNLTT